jgi:hypothetical protein
VHERASLEVLTEVLASGVSEAIGRAQREVDAIMDTGRAAEGRAPASRARQPRR